MAKTIQALTVKIGGNSKALNRELARSRKKVNAFGKQLKSMAGMIAGAFAAGAVIKFASSTIKAYDIQAKAESELLVALKGRKIAQRDLINQAQRLQKITLFGDEETIHAQALIAAFVKEKDQIKQIIPLVQDFATAKKMNLAAAADLVSKTLGSTTNALTRYGISVTGAVGSNERLASVTKGLADAFKGQAQAAALAGAGGLKQLANVWGDVKEKIGGAIFKGIRPMITELKNLLTPSRNVVKTMKDQQTEANLLAIQLTNTNLKEDERRKILGKLKDISPDIIKGLKAENISIKTLKENLRKYNEEFVKKIAIQENADKVSGARKNLGKAVIHRINNEIALEKKMLGIKNYIGKSNKEEAKQINNVLFSTASLADKFQQIQQIDNKFRKQGAKGAYFGHVGDAMQALVQSQAKEKKLQNELNSQIKDYENIYRRIFGLAENSDILTKPQRDQIDEYNRLTKSSLDYSKALTKEQQAELDKLNAGKKQFVNLKSLENQVTKLQAERDKLAAKAFVNPNAVPQSAIDQINALDKKIKGLTAKIKKLKALAPKTSGPTAVIPDYKMPSIPKIGATPNLFGLNELESDLNKTIANLKDFKSVAIDVSAAVQSGMANMAVGIADSFAGLVSGAATIGDFFNSILLVVASFMRQLGEQLIAAAVAALAFKKLLLNPIAAIAAGLALIIAATVITASFKKGPGMKEGGIVPKGFNNDTYQARLSSDEIVMPPKKLEVFFADMMKKLNPANNLMTLPVATNSNKMLKLSALPIDVKISGTFKKSGTDLVAVVEQVQSNRKRVRGY